jgi:hypothetical protein
VCRGEFDERTGPEPGDHVDVTSFRSEQVVGGYGVNLGVHRWTGSARYRGQDVPWAAVLKIVDGSQDDGADGSWDYWRREASAYESGLLADLPGGLSAPRFLGLEERSDGTLWLWLESVSMEDDPIWPHSSIRLGGAPPRSVQRRIPG